MGCNFYLKKATQEFHIGKSNRGWYFLLAVYPEHGISNFDDWKKLFLDPESEIYDENGEKILPTEMISCIASRSFPGEDSAEEIMKRDKKNFETRKKVAALLHKENMYNSYEDYMMAQHAEYGIKGLWRRREEENYILHPHDPNATYDYVLSRSDPKTGNIFY